MSDRTPIEKLDDAVREFLEESGADGSLSGWVLMYEQQRIIAEAGVQPLVQAYDYTVSPSSGLAQAAGLTRHLSLIIDQHMLGGYFGDEDG